MRYRNRVSRLPLLVLSCASVMTLCLGSAAYVLLNNTIEVNSNFNRNSYAKVCRIGSTYYSNIGKAISVAKSGDVIVVLPGNSGEHRRENDNYVIKIPESVSSGNTTLTIPQGVTLSLPYELDSSGEPVANSKTGTASTNNHSFDNPNTYCKSSVTLEDGLTLINKGTIEIGGLIGATGAGQQTGSTQGNYSELVLGNGSTLVNHGTVNLYGLLDESEHNTSHFIQQNDSSLGTEAALNMPMNWYDFPGGSCLKAVYDSIDTAECIPLDDFYLENNVVPTTIYGGTSVTAWVNLYAARTVGEYDMKIIDNDQSGIIDLIEPTSYINSNFERENETDAGLLEHHLDFYGNANFNDLVIDVKEAITNIGGSILWGLASVMGIPAQVSSNEAYFPLCHIYQVTLNSLNDQKTTFNAQNIRYKLLANSSLEIGENVDFICNSLVAYDDTDVLTGRGTHASNLHKSITSSQLEASTLIVNGSLSTSTLAGRVSSATENASIRVSSSTLTTMYEPKNGYGDDGSSAMYEGEEGWFILNYSLDLVDGNSSSSGLNCSPGLYSTYLDNDGLVRWKNDSVFVNTTLSLSSYLVDGNNESPASSLDDGVSGTFRIAPNLIISPESSDYQIEYQWTIPNGVSLSEREGNTTTAAEIYLDIPGCTVRDGSDTYNISLNVRVLDSNDNEVGNATSNINIVMNGPTCVIAGTLVSMADGTYKPIEDVEAGDRVFVFNHETGKRDVAKVLFNDPEELDFYQIIWLNFSGGQRVGVSFEHAFFDVTLNRYVYIRENNAKEFIGHQFYHEDGTAYTLESVEIEDVFTRVFDLVTSTHMNFFTEGFLGLPGAIEGLFNIFEYNQDLSFNKSKKEHDIQKYGLYTYEDFKDYILYETYASLPFPYFKVAVGKGMITYQKILELLARYSEYLK